MSQVLQADEVAPADVLRVTLPATVRRPVRFGERELLAYVLAPGCPRSVAARYRACCNDYRDALARRGRSSAGSAYGRFLELLPAIQGTTAAMLEDSERGYELLMALAPQLGQVAEAPLEDDPEAYSAFLLGVLLAVIPGLTREEADGINEATAERLMASLHWFGGPPATAAALSSIQGEAAVVEVPGLEIDPAPVSAGVE